MRCLNILSYSSELLHNKFTVCVSLLHHCTFSFVLMSYRICILLNQTARFQRYINQSGAGTAKIDAKPITLLHCEATMRFCHCMPFKFFFTSVVNCRSYSDLITSFFFPKNVITFMRNIKTMQMF